MFNFHVKWLIKVFSGSLSIRMRLNMRIVAIQDFCIVFVADVM